MRSPGSRAVQALANRKKLASDLGPCEACRKAEAIAVYRLRGLCGPCLRVAFAASGGSR